MAWSPLILRTLVALLTLLPPAYSWKPKVSNDILRRAEIDISQVADAYDYVIVGGGQAGVVIASRLTEDPNVSVLVVEYGYFDTAPTVSEPSSAVRYNKDVMYNMTSVPQKAINGHQQSIFAACCVGGGSTINGMLLNRGSKADYDAWEKLGNPGWGWDGLYPYFIKSSHFDAPAPELAEEFNMTWGEKSYDDGPIHLSYSPWQWPTEKYQFQAMREIGCPTPSDGSDGHAYGVFWYPSALDNATVTRSYAVTGYYNPHKDRKGFNILTGWRVDEVEFDDYKHAIGIVMQQRQGDDIDPASSNGRVKVKAKREIIVAAGALHSPQVLQRSGIGPKALLEEAGIPVRVDLPGVGSNLQDHAVTGMGYNFTNAPWPNPNSLNNETFRAWAQQEWDDHRRGPFSLATGNLGSEVPLPIIDPEGYQSSVELYKGLNVKDYLPEHYSDEQIAGYEKQRAILSEMMAQQDNAWLELPLTGQSSYSVVLIKVLSRGTVLLNTSDIYADPVVDYNTLINPTDKKMLVSMIRFVRRVHQMPGLQAIDPVELRPGPSVTSDDDIANYIFNATGSSTAHNSGSNAMMPQDLGGVVGSDLLVHGVTGLSVADSSIMPILIGAHTCSTVYAIAEKAADIIKARNQV